MDLRVIETPDLEALQEFFGRVPEGDRTFFNEDVLDPEVVRSFMTPRNGDERAILIDETGTIIGWLALFWRRRMVQPRRAAGRRRRPGQSRRRDRQAPRA